MSALNCTHRWEGGLIMNKMRLKSTCWLYFREVSVWASFSPHSNAPTYEYYLNGRGLYENKMRMNSNFHVSPPTFTPASYPISSPLAPQIYMHIAVIYHCIIDNDWCLWYRLSKRIRRIPKRRSILWLSLQIRSIFHTVCGGSEMTFMKKTTVIIIHIRIVSHWWYIQAGVGTS